MKMCIRDRAQRERPAGGEKIDDVEVIEVRDERRDRRRGGDEEHVGQRNGNEFPHGTRAVDLGTLVELRRDVHQHAREGDHGIRDADPHIDHDRDDARERRVQKERQRRLDNAELHKKHVHRACRFQRAGAVSYTHLSAS